MQSRVQEKQKAITLRKKGYSYNDILKKVPVAKSSLSVWLADLPLTREEKHYLKSRTEKNISSGRIKAAAAHRRLRAERYENIRATAKEEFTVFKSDPLFQVGVALYWAEGAKRNTFFAFSNSDIDMIRLMLMWMERFLKVQRTQVHPRLYIHKPYAHERCELFWANHIGIPIEYFKKTIYKPTGKLVKKRPQYKGVLRISTNMEHLRKMQFWIRMLIEESRIT